MDFRPKSPTKPRQTRTSTLASPGFLTRSFSTRYATTTNTLAINWTWGIHHADWRLRWSKFAESPTDADWQDKPDICRKFVNTKAFHDAFCHHCNPRSRVGLGA